MSAYAQSLSDFDIGNFYEKIKEGVTQGADEIVTEAEQATKEAATSVVRQGRDLVSGELSKVVGGGGATTVVPPSLPVQPTETPTGTTKPSMLSGLSRYAIPAGVGVGVYLWQKSVLWALGAAVATAVIVPMMRKGGK